jgi:acetyltransferase EpsM
MKKLNYIFGASGHAKVILDILNSRDINVEAIIDDNPKVDFLLNIIVSKTIDFEFSDKCQFIIAIGNNLIRRKIVINNNFTFYKAIDSTASISKFAAIGDGTVVMPNAVVNADASIGNHCIINSRSVVEHDCLLGNYVHISPGASLAGNVSIGEGTHIGIGSCVIQGVKIGKWVTVGAGAVIINDVPDFAVVVGNPGKIIKFNTNINL